MDLLVPLLSYLPVDAVESEVKIPVETEVKMADRHLKQFIGYCFFLHTIVKVPQFSRLSLETLTWEEVMFRLVGFLTPEDQWTDELLGVSSCDAEAFQYCFSEESALNFEADLPEIYSEVVVPAVKADDKCTELCLQDNPIFDDSEIAGGFNADVVIPAVEAEKLIDCFKMDTDSPGLIFREIIPDVTPTSIYEKLISRNDWWVGVRILPDYGFPSDKDVVLSGIRPTSPAIMQDALNELLPFHNLVDDHFFQEIVETDDIVLELDSCSIDLSVYNDWNKGKKGGHNSVLNTGATSYRAATFREAVLSVKKRNMNVPKLSSILYVEDIANKAVNRFFEAVVDVSKLCTYPDFICEGEVSYFKDYVVGKNPNPEQFIDPICLSSMDKYRHMLKGHMKPVEDNSIAFERPLAATITYHDKGKVMSTSPIFLAAAFRLMACLYDKISIPSGKFHQLFSLDACCFDEVKHWKEIDFSKFDKSQQELHHKIQEKIFLRLGVPASFVSTWFESHKVSKIADGQNGLFYSVDYQRRTGDACTYLGNTIVTLSVLSYVYNLKDPNVLMVCASGDDSLIGTLEPLPRDNEHLCSTLFNFEAKFPHNQPFICSKFLLTMPTFSGGRKVVAVPNPAKLLIKLGKKNLTEETFDAWFESWLDLIHYFDDYDLISKLSQMVSYRYIRKPGLFTESAICSFKSLFANKRKIKKILFPSMPLELQPKKRRDKSRRHDPTYKDVVCF